MAKIIVSSFSNVTWKKQRYLDSYVEGFIRVLQREGNDVYSFRCNDFYRGNKNLVSTKLISKAVKDISPDLIITFNNAFPYADILKDTDCPVACFASDSCAFFLNKHLIERHADRYYFFNFSNDTIKAIPEWFPVVDKRRIFLFGHATDLRATDIPQDIDVSFIGSMANWNRDFPEYFKSFWTKRMSQGDQLPWYENTIKDNFFAALDKFKQDPFSKFTCNLPDFYPSTGSIETTAILLLTCKARFDVLSQFTDMGLKVFGYPYAYADVILYNYELFRCFDYTTSVSMEHATYNFNRSKISLNLPHAHAAEGFSWRVCDILASNAVLLSCKQPDLVNLTKSYVDLPMFESPIEARDLGKKLLDDDPWRKDLSLACQQVIDDKCRFEEKFKAMASAIGSVDINFFGSEGKEGIFKSIEEHDFLSKIGHARRTMRSIQAFKRKIRGQIRDYFR